MLDRGCLAGGVHAGDGGKSSIAGNHKKFAGQRRIGSRNSRPATGGMIMSLEIELSLRVLVE